VINKSFTLEIKQSCSSSFPQQLLHFTFERITEQSYVNNYVLENKIKKAFLSFFFFYFKKRLLTHND